MNETKSILLSSFRNKKSVNENASLSINLSGNNILLPESEINDAVDAYEIYLNERKNSNKFRLIVNVRPFCSNVLFNPYTEIVKYEGSDSAVCLNYSSVTESATVGKDRGFHWNQKEAIRDTQLSSEICGYDYHCGIDIFNNHILRNKVFKAVNYHEVNSKKALTNLAYDSTGGEIYGENYMYIVAGDSMTTSTAHTYVSNDFNTIDDYMRDKNGWPVPKEFNKNTFNINDTLMITYPLHLYQKPEIMTFDECISEKLVDENGWYGFKNRSVINYITLTSSTSGNTEIDKVINNRKSSDFIDMYPSRDLYSFNPKYNPYRKRLEKNWNYCLTYPYASTTKNNGGSIFPFFHKYGGLKVYMFDEGTVADDETSLLTIYTVSQHGLMVGDTVNIYKNYVNDEDEEILELPYDSAEVVNVVDKYIFQVVKDSSNISNEWILVDRTEESGVYKKDGKEYPICESNRCNIDPKAQDVFIRRVVNGVECKYYVRKFARIPNFKFKDCEINDYTLYGDKENDIIKKFSGGFESHISKLGFANTSYGDDTVEIVFTDDIDTSYIRDNLGRPLSDVYLTILKNNKGYKEWYGIDDTPQNISGDTIEYSHCFGKLKGSFLLSEYFRESSDNSLKDVRDLTNSNNGFSNEISFEDDWDFFGDVCCYSPVDCDEQVIQSAMYRFNTVQRELENANTSFSGTLEYDDVFMDENSIPYDNDALAAKKHDPFDLFANQNNKLFKHSVKKTKRNVTTQKEGYYYQPHYRIPFKTVSTELKSEYGIEYEIISIEHVEDSPIFTFRTFESNGFQKNTKLILYVRSKNIFYYMTVKNISSTTRFTCTIEDEDGNSVINIKFNVGTVDEYDITDLSVINDFVIIKKPSGIPDYAKIIKDGSCRFCWRDIISNGIENDPKVYPFTNGAFYVMRQINFFLRRQDPNKDRLRNITDGWDYTPDGENISNYPNLQPDYKSNYEINEIESC